jgi:amidase
MSNINLLTASASNLQALLSTSEITSVQLLEKCLEQIEKFEGTGDGGGNGWKLKAMMFITRKEKLMSIAKTLDDERKAGKSRGKLHGIPIVLKDQWQVSPDYGMPTTAGMSALLEASNIENSEVVEKV